MTRSTYKLPYTAKSLKASWDLIKKTNVLPDSINQNNPGSKQLQLFLTQQAGEKQVFRSPLTLYQRSSTIVPEMIGSIVKIHSGHKFVKFIVSEHTVGYKFGEFAPTKKRALYKKKKKR